MKSPKAKLPHSGGALKSLALLVLAALLILASGCTVVRISDGKIISGGQEEDAYLASDEFDAEAYVERIWASEVLPYVSENARDYTELAAQLKQDFAKTGEAYGSTHSSNANNYSFIVKTTARALNYNNESRTGYVSADIAPYDSKEDFKIYVGPVFKGHLDNVGQAEALFWRGGHRHAGNARK